MVRALATADRSLENRQSSSPVVVLAYEEKESCWSFVEELEADIAHQLGFDVRPVPAASEGGERSEGAANSEEDKHGEEAAAVGRRQRVVDEMTERERDNPAKRGFDGTGHNDYCEFPLVRPAIVRELSEETGGAQRHALFDLGTLLEWLIHRHSRPEVLEY
jgi:hypothetical protein